jgi:hypothetical protein
VEETRMSEVMLIKLGTPDKDSILKLQEIRANHSEWSAHGDPLVAPFGYEIVIRKVNHEIHVIRRRVVVPMRTRRIISR